VNGSVDTAERPSEATSPASRQCLRRCLGGTLVDYPRDHSKQRDRDLSYSV